MDNTIYDKYRRAGQVAADAREYGLSLIKEGVRFLDVAEGVEARIREQGCSFAFPVNISRNDLAAHYSPRHDDQSVFHKGDLVKLDVGVHVDGYIADTASTIEVGTMTYNSLITASRTALDNAIKKIGGHSSLTEVGKTIQETIQSFGFKSIENLTGHSLERYVLHSGLSIPNINDPTFIKVKPKVGDVIAVEPFASNGAGHVISGDGSNIYLFLGSVRGRLVRDQKTRIMLQKIHTSFGTLPFAQRWCVKNFSEVDSLLKKLSFFGSLKHYPQLKDKNKGMVSQAEHTVIITEDGCEVIT